MICGAERAATTLIPPHVCSGLCQPDGLRSGLGPVARVAPLSRFPEPNLQTRGALQSSGSSGIDALRQRSFLDRKLLVAVVCNNGEL